MSEANDERGFDVSEPPPSRLRSTAPPEVEPRTPHTERSECILKIRSVLADLGMRTRSEARPLSSAARSWESGYFQKYQRGIDICLCPVGVK